MQRTSGQVLIIIGSTGSGKTTLAKYTAKRQGWCHIEEDDYWVKNGWRDQLRTEEHETIIQQQVSADLLKLCAAGNSAVIEFVIYKAPPNALTTYTSFLKKHLVPYRIIVLRPTLEIILERIKQRGRPMDLADLSNCRRDVQHQLECLSMIDIEPMVCIDSTNLTVEKLYKQAIPAD